MRSGEGFIMMYAITSASTFQEIPAFREHIKRAKDKDKVGLPTSIIFFEKTRFQ